MLASRLRAAIGVPDALVRVNGGYALAVELTDLSAARAAEQLHTAVRAGDPRAVRAAAQEALDYWRGPALADLRSAGTVRDGTLRRLAEAGETESARTAELAWALGFVQAQAGDNDFASAIWLAARTVAVALSQARAALTDLTTAYTISGFAWPRSQNRLNELRSRLAV